VGDVLEELRGKVDALPDDHHYGKQRGGCIDLRCRDGSTRRQVMTRKSLINDIAKVSTSTVWMGSTSGN
jgi:hypothetical protein